MRSKIITIGLIATILVTAVPTASATLQCIGPVCAHVEGGSWGSGDCEAEGSTYGEGNTVFVYLPAGSSAGVTHYCNNTPWFGGSGIDAAVLIFPGVIVRAGWWDGSFTTHGCDVGVVVIADTVAQILTVPCPADAAPPGPLVLLPQ